MKIAVAGASGGVGTIVAEALTAAGHEVRAIDVTPPATESVEDFVIADLTSYEQTLGVLERAEAVVNVAGLNGPIPAPEWTAHNTNVLVSYNVLHAAAELGVPRVVQSSSVNAIGLAWSRNPEFDYFPIDLAHRSRNEDGYSLSKLIQELQADSLTRRYEGLSVVSLRLHAVLTGSEQAQMALDLLGRDWAVHGLFGYCTFESVTDAVRRACEVPIAGHEVLWVVEPETFVTEDSRVLSQRYYPDVPIVTPLEGRASFFDTTRTREILGWVASTENAPPAGLITLEEAD